MSIQEKFFGGADRSEVSRYFAGLGVYQLNELSPGVLTFGADGLTFHCKPVGDGWVVSTDESADVPAFERLIERIADGRAVSERMDFGQAIRALKDGKRVARAGWNSKWMWLGLQVPDAHSKMGLPYVFMSTVTGQLVPWLASQTDVLAEDWSEVV